MTELQWVLMPVEPTDAITWAGQQARYPATNSITVIYRAMLAAAPKVEREGLTDEQLSAIAYKGYDDYWTEGCDGVQSEAWAASAKAVLAAHGIAHAPSQGSKGGEDGR